LASLSYTESTPTRRKGFKMKKKIPAAIIMSILLVLSAGASADPVSAVFTCKLNDGKTKEDAMAVNAKWLAWARSVAGTDEITSSFVETVVGDFGTHLWVDTYPSLSTWAKVVEADLDNAAPEISQAFEDVETCSSNRLLSATPTTAAK